MSYCRIAEFKQKTVKNILTKDSETWNIFSVNMAPRILTDEQKQRWLDISSDFSFHLDIFNRVITGEETCCIQYESEGKCYSI